MNRTIKTTLAAILAALMLLAAMPSFVTGRAAADERQQNGPNESAEEASLSAASVQPRLTPSYTPSSYYQNGQYYTKLLNVQLTGDQRTDIVNVAVSQFGYHEGNSVYDLGGGNTNGSNNYTEYGYWYGTNVNGWSNGWYDQWCAMFVSWCARQAQIPTSILKNSAGAGHSSSYFNIPYYDGANYTPQVGDLFFTKGWTHVGLVKSVSGNTFETIEGNSSDRVTSRWLNKSNYYFGVPNYTSTPVTPPAAPTNVHTTSGKTLFSCNEYIEFAWDASVGATGYWVHLRYDNTGEEVYSTSVGNNTFHTCAPLNAGQYTFIVRASNSAGYSNDPAFVMFRVYDSAPAAPTGLRTVSGKSLFRYGEPVEFVWDASELATTYWVYVWKDGVEIVNTEVGQSLNYTYTSAAGQYTFIVRAANGIGFSDSSAYFYFTIFDAPPAPPTNLHTSTWNTLFSSAETIEFLWDPAPTAQCYCVQMWQNGTMLYQTEEFEGLSFTETMMNPGNYTIVVRSSNWYDFCEGSASLDFTVYRSTGYFVTINYLYENGTAAANPYSQIYPYGYSYAVISPTIEGYTASASVVQGVVGLDDVTVNVIYTQTPSTTTPGDVDKDGRITISDAIIVMRMAMNIIPVSNLAAADMDGDGAITTIDALMIMRVSLGLG